MAPWITTVARLSTPCSKPTRTRASFTEATWSCTRACISITPVGQPLMPCLFPCLSRARQPDRVALIFSKQRAVVAAVLAVAACITLIATFGWFQQPEERPVTVEPAEAKTESFVTIKQVRAARWESGNLPTSEGTRLGAGTMRLTEGLVTLRFGSGAKVNLEAPSELTLINAMNVHLVKGTVVAEIPDSATGFRVTTPSANVVDFGTRFSVSVAAGTG